MKSHKRTGCIRWAIILVIAALFGLYILLPVGFGIAAIFPGRADVGAPPDGFEAVTLPTEDHIALSGWYRPPDNHAAILLLHGAGGSRESVRAYAQMLAGHGYGVLALDLRGHGTSEGKTNRRGWQGARDVKAAVEFLLAREEVQQIGALGISLGAEVLLGAASEDQPLRAIVSDGATHRSVQELLALPSERSLVRNFTARVMYAAMQLLSGEEPPPPLLESMVVAQDTHFLLIAAGDDDREVAFNELFAQTVGERAALRIAPGAPHTGAYGRFPQEYEQRVIDFFQKMLP